MVGDSWKSDIIPAVTVGLRAVHVDHPNWHTVEGVGKGTKELPSVKCLSEVPTLILNT